MPYARIWPDPIAAVIAAIASEGIDAYPAVPNPRPAEFAVVQRLGGGIDNDAVFDIAQVDVEVWSGDQGDSLVPVWDATRTVIEALRMMPAATGDVARVDIETSGYLPDEITGSPRVIITAGVWLRPTTGS